MPTPSSSTATTAHADSDEFRFSVDFAELSFYALIPEGTVLQPSALSPQAPRSLFFNIDRHETFAKRRGSVMFGAVGQSRRGGMAAGPEEEEEEAKDEERKIPSLKKDDYIEFATAAPKRKTHGWKIAFWRKAAKPGKK